MIQSESRTWPAFVAREKTVTRRLWKPRTAAWYRRGREFDAYHNAAFQGGKLIGRARVVQDAYPEELRFMPNADWHGEGFSYFNLHPRLIPKQALGEIWTENNCSRRAFNRWRSALAEQVFWVCRFEVIHVEDWAIEHLDAVLRGDAQLGAVA